MISPLLELQLRLLKGRVVSLGRLLRQPRYVLGAIVGVLYLGSTFLATRYSASPAFLDFGRRLVQSTPLSTEIALSVFLLAIFTLGWLVLPSRPGLRLTEAEMVFLLSAPIQRREVLRYAIRKAQVPMAVAAAVLALVGHRHEPWLRSAASLFLLFSVVDLQEKGRSLTRARWEELGPAAKRLRFICFTVMAMVLWTLLAATIAPVVRVAWSEVGGQWPRISSWLPFARALDAGFESSIVPWLLAPLRVVVRPTLVVPVGWAEWAVTWLPPLGLWFILEQWVLRSEARFEDATLARARHDAVTRDPRARWGRLGERDRQRTVFDLAAIGRPAMALWWKNLMRFTRRPPAAFASGTLIAFGAIVAVACLLGDAGFYNLTAGAVTLGVTAFLVFPVLGGLVWRNDFREDLLHLETVRAWPVSSFSLVVAEVCAPALIAASLSMLGLALALMPVVAAVIRGLDVNLAMTLSVFGVRPLTLIVVVFASVVPLIAAVSLLSSALQNLLVLLFPGWVRLGVEPASAISIGQYVVFGLAASGVMVLGLLPSAVVIFGLGALGYWLGIGPVVWAIPLLSLSATAPILVVIRLLIGVTAERWERFDPSEELLAGG